jgi:hypothetical protein
MKEYENVVVGVVQASSPGMMIVRVTVKIHGVESTSVVEACARHAQRRDPI